MEQNELIMLIISVIINGVWMYYIVCMCLDAFDPKTIALNDAQHDKAMEQQPAKDHQKDIDDGLIRDPKTYSKKELAEFYKQGWELNPATGTFRVTRKVLDMMNKDDCERNIDRY